MTQPKLTGLSLSSCVWDILRGAISLDQVSAIYCGFSWEGDLDLGQLPSELYWDGMWRKYPREQVMEVLNQLTIHPLPKEISQWELGGSTRNGNWMAGNFTVDRFRNFDDRIDVRN